ncbi:abortive infection family protein [Streptomyces sp. NPDC051207]|uniref:abortive infection family protein n=1 Tax=Streptomyces sp. NPDC051207 TaxID=3154641 RepID=UPI0034291D4A
MIPSVKGCGTSSVTPGPDGTDGVKKILEGVASIGVAELRNRGYGTGHGQAGAPSNLIAGTRSVLRWRRGARAVQLDTLADPAALLRKQQHSTASAAAGSPQKGPKPTRNTPTRNVLS